MKHVVSRIVALLIAARWPLLVLALVSAALAWEPASRVRFDRSIERMFADTDPLLPPYERLKKNFGGNEIVLAVYADDNLLAPDGSGLARLQAIGSRLKAVPGVRDVLSLHEVNDLLEKLEQGKRLGSLLNIFSRRKKPEARWNGPAILNPKSAMAGRYRDLFAGYTHSADGKTAAVVCLLEPSAPVGRAPDPATAEEPGETADSGDPRPTDEAASIVPLAAVISDADGDPKSRTIANLQTVIRDLPDGLAPGVLAGEPVMVVEGFELLEVDGHRLSTWSTVLLGLTILLCFRSVRWLVAPILVVQWTLLLTKASLVLSGTQLSMVSSMLTAIITVVGVAAVVHLIVHYRELRIAGVAPREALWKSGIVLAGPIVGAVATDVAGFGSLTGANVGPVQDFGTMTALGALLVFPALCLILPAMTLVGARDTGPTQQGWGEGQLGDWLSRSIGTIRAWPVTVGIATALFTILAVIGALKLEVETDFTRNFRSTSRIVHSYNFVETRLGGAGVWDVVVPAPPRLDREYLARVRKLEARLREIKLPDRVTGQPTLGLTKVISLVDALDAADDDPTVVSITSSPELRAKILTGAMPTFMGALRSSEVDQHGQARLRIMLRARERQPAQQKRLLIQEVTRITQEEFPASEQSAGGEVTGFFVLLTSLIESMLRDQWVTFGMATGTIFLMVLVAFRSLKMALISLVPNALPILGVMGLMGWLGLKINMGAAMIAAVSMGLSVDSSIHYLASFRNERRAGRTVGQSLAEVQKSVGRAMLFSTLALVVGFGVLMISEFVPTVYFGALVSLAMLGALLGNLVVLPLLLSWVEHDNPPPPPAKEKEESTPQARSVSEGSTDEISPLPSVEPVHPAPLAGEESVTRAEECSPVTPAGPEPKSTV